MQHESCCGDFENDCDGFACEAISICATLEGGRCVICSDSPSCNREYQRNLFLISLKIQNCSGSNVKITSARLSLVNRIIIIDQNTRKESIVNFFSFDPSVHEHNHYQPVAHVLQLTASCGCENEMFGGGLVDVETYEPTCTDLFCSNTTLPPGDCCISVVIAIDQSKEFPLFGEPQLERTCLVVEGFLQRSSCCRFTKSLLLPGDCALRFLRDSTIEDC